MLAVSFFGSSAMAQNQPEQDVYLHCENDLFGPLLFLSSTVYPQLLNVKLVVQSDSGTGINARTIVVIDNDVGRNVAIFYFNFDDTGKLTLPSGGSSIVQSYGPSPDGIPQTSYESTVGVFPFYGDNLPLAAWLSYRNWDAPEVVDHMQFDSDLYQPSNPKPNTYYKLNIHSDYSYGYNWGWITFLGFQLPHLPGAKPTQSTSKTLTFNLRNAPPPGQPKPLVPPTKPTLSQAPTQPFTCNAPTCKTCKNMAVASFDRFQAGIAITDTPISYTPGVGGTMAFTLHYHQRLTNQPTTFNYSNVGPLWQCSWISYIAGGPTNGQSDATYYAPDGSQYTYNGYQQTVAGGAVANQGDFQGTEGWTHATLHYRQNPERYERWLPDGTVESYEQAIGNSANRLFFLTFVTDPQGNVTTYKYNANAALNGQARLDSVIGPTQAGLIFGYNTTNPLEIARVTRSCDGLTAQLQYTNGQLTAITDPIGITSSFQYVAGSTFIRTMTTPYGNTTFHSADNTGVLEADMTNPLGQTERIEYQEYLATTVFPASETSVPTATGLNIDNTNLNTANTFYWDRRAMSDQATAMPPISIDSPQFYALAEVSHWAQSSQGSIPVPLSTKERLEGRVWYNYPSQPDADTVDTTAEGATTSPSMTARVLDNTQTQLTQATYNVNGLITKSIDPLGRTTNYNYYPNNIDLWTVTQTNTMSASGTGYDTLSTMTNYIQHLPWAVTDASGQTTTMTYNGQGQLLTSTDALNEKTTLTYYGNGYLNTVTAPMTGATTTYTYDSAGRTQTVKDSQNYTVTMAYDNLDRLTTTTYPDSTTDKIVYDRLDVGKTIDRQNRVITNQYDAIRELIQTTDPLQRTTSYTWCTCGGLSTLTDANNNVTTWVLDGEGRVTAKQYADYNATTNNQITYVYETNTSRLHSMTDALTNQYNTAHSASYVTATYAYNNDNTLSTTTYGTVPSVAATPSDTFSYDSVYNRVTSMIDGTGTTTYAYNTISGTMTTGAGRLSTVTIPVDNATGTMTYTGTVTYGYDVLGRVNNRQLDSNNTVTTGFDSLGRVTAVTNALSPTGSFTYAYADSPAPSNRLASVTYPASTGLSTSYTYFGSTDTQDWERLETIQNMSGAIQLSNFGYTYNPVGTISTWTTQTGTTTAIANTLTYDNADQLTGCTATGTIPGNTYRYDPAGNRLAGMTLSGTTITATTSGTFNNLNQLLKTGPGNSLTISGTTTLSSTFVSINGVTATLSGTSAFSASVALPTGTNSISVTAVPTSSNIAPVTKRFSPLTTTGTATTSLTYDANGNTITDEYGNSYTWDALNRLTKITYYPSNAYTTMAYDGLSRRTQIQEYTSTGTLTSTKNYIWIGSEIAEERNSSNAIQKQFFPQGETQLVSGTLTPYYYTRDHLGSVREMCSSTGTITSRMAYDPYGVTTTVSGTVVPTKQYAGTMVHPASGLYLTLWRIYDALMGLWRSRDPKGESEGINLYGYVYDDPTNGVDLSGLSGSFDVVFYPFGPKDPKAEPTNQPVRIIFHSDPKCLCKNIKIFQRVSVNGGGSSFDDTNKDGTPNSPFYPVQDTTNGNPSIYDRPGADDPSYWIHHPLSFAFTTCAVCMDTGETLGCVSWGFTDSPAPRGPVHRNSGGGNNIPAIPGNYIPARIR